MWELAFIFNKEKIHVYIWQINVSENRNNNKNL